MNWAIKIISKELMTKISHISWGGYDKGGVTTKAFTVLSSRSYFTLKKCILRLFYSIAQIEF